jgi:hypothetical protein
MKDRQIQKVRFESYHDTQVIHNPAVEQYFIVEFPVGHIVWVVSKRVHNVSDFNNSKPSANYFSFTMPAQNTDYILALTRTFVD